ncbi:MAG: YecA family protein [Acidimicrobiales bacterium]
MKVGRNSPCPCGSQLKAKRCCLAEPHLRTSTPRATLARLQASVASDLAGIDLAGFRSLYDELIYLPELDISVHVRLPGVRTPQIVRAAEAIATGDGDTFDAALRDARPTVDTFERRLDLAQAVLDLRDRGRITPALAAVAIIDLNQPDSAFVTSSLAQAIAVNGGEERTPAGLLVAAR